jgi:hypothetical protein
MEKNYFTALGPDNKIELMFNYGEVIRTVETNDRYILLFLLDNFFVEIHTDKVKKEVLAIEIQEDSDVLHAYIKDLDISDLLDAA